MTSYNRLLVAIVAMLLLPSAHAVNTWESPSADLAKQIAGLTGPGTITFTVTNRSSIAADDVPLIRRAIEHNLRSAGVIVRPKNADADVRVTLSQNVQGWLWVAEVQEGSETKVTMLTVPGASAANAEGGGQAITLRTNLVFAQSDPILDVALLDGHLIILDLAHISAYTHVNGAWQQVQTFNIPSMQTFPRDVRGRIVPATGHLFDVYLPGMECTAAKTGDSWGMTVTCSLSDDPWPLASQKAFFNAKRNFFTGVVVPGFGPKLPSFYSAAEVVRPTATAFLLTDVNGAAHLLENGSHKLVIGARDWGSDIAAVHSECGSGAQVLTSAAGWPAADSLRAYEISGREATPVSAPLNFDGTITALWADATGASAIVVVQKPQESDYEAYSVSVSCSH